MAKFFFIALLFVFVDKSFATEVETKFKAAKIVTDLIPKAPEGLLDVEFDCGFTKLGNKFTPLQVRNRPKVTWRAANESEFYTLIMTDAESSKGEWLHWLVGNIPGILLDKGTELTSFFPSAPPKNSGEHRYVFLYFKQAAKIDFQGYVKISTFHMEGRDKFSTKTFVNDNDLGTPVAGNFYLASWDESCNEMYKLVEENDKKIV